MSCKAATCTYKNVSKNATRARRHLLSCALAVECFPGMLDNLLPRRDGDNDAGSPDGDCSLPALTSATRTLWRQRFAQVQLESGFACSAFDTDGWRSVLRLISGNRFDGPGGRNIVARTHLPVAVGASDGAAAACIIDCVALSASLDWMTDENGCWVYNIMVYTPRPILVCTFRLGVPAGTADTLLARLEAGLSGPLLKSVATSSSAELAGGASPQLLFSSRRVLALCTDSPSTMVALRTRAVDRGQFLFAFRCAAHESNLVASDAARVAVCALALRESLIITVFFTRSYRARSLLQAVHKMLAGGGAEVGALRTYSRTRWAGEGATIASVGANLPALQHTLVENGHSEAPIVVPVPVAAAVNSTAAADAIRRALPFLCFIARIVEHLEADSAPLSSYTGVFACLPATLANHFTDISVAERQLLQGALERRYTSFSDLMVELAFFLDPFWSPVRGRLSMLRWGGQSLAYMRDAAVERLCGGHVS